MQSFHRALKKTGKVGESPDSGDVYGLVYRLYST